jgi:hypothetical protein
MYHCARTLLPLLAIACLPFATWAQERADECFFGADFEDGTIPGGWEVGPLVEVQDAAGNGLDSFVVAWTVGNAAAANAGGFFPVPDVPIGNQFAMANDDAPPCNCDMGNVALTTPPIDLTGRSGVALECRVFHEQILGGGPAVVEANIGGSNWITMATVPVQAGDWQHLFLNLTAFDGQPALRLRFRWSDNGTWAAGFAVDDICLRERNTHDLAVVQAYTHDATADPFTTGDQSLKYSYLPLEQAGPFTVSAELMNRGLATLDGVTLSATITLNGVVQGTWTSGPAWQLLPGQRLIAPVTTGWTPDAVGQVEVTVNASSSVEDDDPVDNSGTASMRISGPGWENGYSAMAADALEIQGEVGGPQAFIAANRVELINAGSVPAGISAVLSGASQEGEAVRAILFDGNLAFVDTSTRHILTGEDIFLAGQGEPLYLPLSAPPTLPAGDYFVGFQHLDGNGQVLVSTSGTGPIGRALFMSGLNFEVTYLRATPMVRLHLSDYGVGLEDLAGSKENALHIFPVPMADQGRVRFTLEQAAPVHLQVLDLSGRVALERGLGTLGAGIHEQVLDVGRLAPGSYVVRVVAGREQLVQRLVVAR